MRTSIVVSTLSFLALVSADTGKLGDAAVVDNNPVGASYEARLPNRPSTSVRGVFLASSNPSGRGVDFQITLDGLPSEGGPFSKSLSPPIHYRLPRIRHHPGLLPSELPLTEPHSLPSPRPTRSRQRQRRAQRRTEPDPVGGPERVQPVGQPLLGLCQVRVALQGLQHRVCIARIDHDRLARVRRSVQDDHPDIVVLEGANRDNMGMVVRPGTPFRIPLCRTSGCRVSHCRTFH